MLQTWNYNSKTKFKVLPYVKLNVYLILTPDFVSRLPFPSSACAAYYRSQK